MDPAPSGSDNLFSQTASRGSRKSGDENKPVTSSPESTGMWNYPDPGRNPSNQLRSAHQADETSAQTIWWLSPKAVFWGSWKMGTGRRGVFPDMSQIMKSVRPWEKLPQSSQESHPGTLERNQDDLKTLPHMSLFEQVLEAGRRSSSWRRRHGKGSTVAAILKWGHRRPRSRQRRPSLQSGEDSSVGHFEKRRRHGRRRPSWKSGENDSDKWQGRNGRQNYQTRRLPQIEPKYEVS